MSIVKPLDFTTLKGHTLDRDRALQSQKMYHDGYGMRRATNYYSVGPPLQNASREQQLIRESGPGFRTAFKAHDEVARIARQHAYHPVMSGKERTTLSKNFDITMSSQEREQLKSLERNFRREHSKGRAQWNIFKQDSSTDEPYLANADNNVARIRLPHKELQKKSPL